MNLLILAHLFHSLIFSPLSMPSPSISNAMSPGLLPSESRTRHRSSHSLTQNSSKDVRWKSEDPIIKDIHISSALRENCAQSWSVKSWTFFAAVQWIFWFLDRHCWSLKVDDCVLSNVFVYLRNNVITEKLIIGRMLCSTTVNYIPENGLEKQVLIPRSYKCNSIWHYPITLILIWL